MIPVSDFRTSEVGIYVHGASKLAFPISQLISQPDRDRRSSSAAVPCYWREYGLFSVTDQVLRRTLPVQDPHRLVLFNWHGRFIGSTIRGLYDAFSYPAYLRNANPGVFSGIGGIDKLTTCSARYWSGA